MHNKKGLVLFFSIISYAFLGCGSNSGVGAQLGNDLELIQYDSSDDNLKDCLKKIHQNTLNKFNSQFERFKMLKHVGYENRNENKSQQDKKQKEMKKVDYLFIYPALAQDQIKYITRSQIPLNNDFFKKDNNENDFVEFFKSQIQNDDAESLTFSLSTSTIELLTVIANSNISDKDKDGLMSKGVDAYYSTFNSFFEDKTGLQIDYRKICENGPIIATFGPHKIQILPSVVVVAIESYFLHGKRTTKVNKAADIKKIYSGRGDASLVKKYSAYRQVLISLDNQINDVHDIISNKTNPIQMQTDVSKKIKNSENITVFDLKDFKNQHQNDIIDFSTFLEKRGNNLSLKNLGGHFELKNGLLTIKSDSIRKEADKFFKNMVGIGQIEVLKKIQSAYNNSIKQKRKVSGQENYGNDANFNISSVSLPMISI